MENFTLFLTGGSFLAAGLLSLLKRLIKAVVAPRWGDLGILVVLLGLAFLISACAVAWEYVPMDMQTGIVSIFAGAIVVYQVLYKAIFKKLIKGELDKDDK